MGPNRGQVEIFGHGLGEFLGDPAAVLFLRRDQRLDQGGALLVFREFGDPVVDRVPGVFGQHRGTVALFVH